jgi:hypothetical protein
MQVNNFRVTIPIIKMLEGEETPEFLELIWDSQYILQCYTNCVSYISSSAIFSE